MGRRESCNKSCHHGHGTATTDQVYRAAILNLIVREGNRSESKVENGEDEDAFDVGMTKQNDSCMTGMWIESTQDDLMHLRGGARIR